MDFKAHLDKLNTTLAPWQNIWSSELLIEYPHSLEFYQEEWLDQLSSLSHYDLWQIDTRSNYDSLPAGNLKELLTNIRELTHLPKIKLQAPRSLPTWAFNRVKEKKKHEIENLLSLLDHFHQQVSFNHIIDIGAGQGHLGRVLAHYLGLKVTGIERNPELIALGIKRQQKYPLPTQGRHLEFLALDFQGMQSLTQENAENLIDEQSLILGLHTCGPLAVGHWDAVLKSKACGGVNFGCCYGKITHPKDFNLSGQAPLKLNPYALTLASRSHGYSSYQEFCFKERVKLYRYALHLYLQEFFEQGQFTSVGNAHFREYAQNFSSYVKIKMQSMELEIKQTEQEIQQWFYQNKLQNLLRRLFLANIVRWQFGRLLEHYILTDRALFLQQQGLRVEMGEFFDEGVSPRNIGILAYKLAPFNVNN